MCNTLLAIAGRIFFTSTQATSIFFNPTVDEMLNLPSHITATYADFICQVPHEIEYQYQVLQEPCTRTPYLTLQQLMQIRLWVYQKVINLLDSFT